MRSLMLVTSCPVIDLQTTQVESITLYQHGARVSRSIDFPIPPRDLSTAPLDGQLLQAVIEGLPGCVDSTSIRISSSFPGVKDAWVTAAEIYRVRRVDLASCRTGNQDAESIESQVVDLLRKFETQEEAAHLMEAQVQYAEIRLQLLRRFREAQSGRVPRGGVCASVSKSLSTVDSLVQLSRLLHPEEAAIRREMMSSRQHLDDAVLQCSLIYLELCRLVGVPATHPEPVTDGSAPSQAAILTTWRNRIEQFLLVPQARVIISIALLPLLGSCNSLESSMRESQRTIPLTINYTVAEYQTSWSPLYDVNYCSGSELLDVSLCAALSQHTGEDWTEAEVTLALGSCPSQITIRPPVLPVEAFEFAPPVASASRQTTTSATAVESTSRTAAATMNASGVEMTRDVTDSPEAMLMLSMCAATESKVAIVPSLIACEAVGSGLTAAYKLMAPITIRSGGSVQRIAITTLHGLQSQSLLWAVPSLSEQVYHQVRAKNDSEFILPASNIVTVTYDGKFLSQSRMPDLINPGNDFRITLGVESAVAVSYVPPKTVRRETGFVTKTQSRDFHSEVLVVARDLPAQKKSLTVLLVDRIPTSGDSRISVSRLDKVAQEEMTEVDFGAAAQRAVQAAGSQDAAFRNTANNHIYNVVHLAKNDQKLISQAYQIEWPADVELMFSDRA